MQSGQGYRQKRSKIHPQKFAKWGKQQAYIRQRIKTVDDFDWRVEEVELIAGVDINFSGKYQNGACVGLIVYSVKMRKIVYEDFMYTVLKEEYVPGFLAFRQLPPTLPLFQRLKKQHPEFWPQVIMVDGNGILHKYQCGYASHLGVVLDMPTIGVAKTFFDVDGLHQNQVEEWLGNVLRNEGDNVTIKGKSGRQWCQAFLVDQASEKHNYVSVGNKISLKSAWDIVRKVTWKNGPEPVRLVDLISRKKVRQSQNKDYEEAKSYQMKFLTA